jgi:F0F1-type ATP synthase membrane subunit b/b'
MKKDILGNAEKEAVNILTKARKQLDDERGRMVTEIQASLANVVVRMAEKIIEREFTTADHARLIKDVEKALPSVLR